MSAHLFIIIITDIIQKRLETVEESVPE